MTTQKFLIKIHKLLDSQSFNITFAPAPNKTTDYFIFCRGVFIGALYSDELYFTASVSLEDFLESPEETMIEYHPMYHIPLEKAVEALGIVIKEKVDQNTFVYDFTSIYKRVRVHDKERFYNREVIFLKFCYENKLLKDNPVDKQDRLIKTMFYKKDLTETGEKYFSKLQNKSFTHYDNNGKTSIEKMLPKWLNTLMSKEN